MRSIIQRLSYKDKIKDDFAWGKQMLNNLELYANSGWSTDGLPGVDTRAEMIWRSYRLYNSQIDEKDFEDDLNPLGFQLGQKKDKIAPYNKAHNKINVLLGELLKRQFNYRATFTNLEGAYVLMEERKNLITKYVAAQIAKEGEIAYLQGQGLPEAQMAEAIQKIEEKYKDVKGPEEIEEYLENQFSEPREIKSNRLLSDLYKRLKIYDLKKDSFKHGLLSDEEHCWIGFVNGQLTIKVLNPLGVFYHKSPETKYVQDGEFAGYKTKMTVADVIDTYKSLTEDQLKQLESKYSEINSRDTEKDLYFPHRELNYLKAGINSKIGSYGYSYSDEVDVIHAAWRSLRKVGFFTFIDDNGELQTEIVPEEFKMDKNNPKYVDIEWEWVPEIWEGTKIDNDIYVDIRPIPHQEIDPDNPYYQPLPYHGVVYNNMNAAQISTMERMRPFQMLYFIVMHKLKQLIASDKGKAIEIDVSRLDPKIGLEETLFYLDKQDIYLYNSAQAADTPGASTRSAVGNAIDRSNANHIINYLNILAYIDEQIGEVAGVTRSREGQTAPYEAVTNSQQSIMQSSTITEPLFHNHMVHWENVLNYLIDLAIKKFDTEGGVFQNMGQDLKKEVFSIKPGEFKNCKFGVFIVDNPRDTEIFKQLQSLVQPLIQSDKVRFSQVAKMIKQTSSSEELIRDLEKFEAQMAQQEQANIEREQQLRAANEEKMHKIEMMRMQHEKALNDADNQTKITVAQIGSFSRLQDQDGDNNGVPDQLEIAKLQAQVAETQEDINLERERMQQEKAEADKDRQLKREEIKSKEKIAKSRPKPKTSK